MENGELRMEKGPATSWTTLKNVKPFSILNSQFSISHLREMLAVLGESL